MKVQIVMPSINLWTKYTKPALESVQIAMMRAKKHNIDSRLLFIDNASTDETVREAGKMVSNIFSHQRNEERWGFQRSVNFGVQDAIERGFDYVLVCNNDIILHPEAIWRLVERFEHPFIKEGDEEIPIGMVTAMDVRGETTPEGLSNLNPNDKNDCPESQHPNFSAFMISTQAWKLVGEFDELFAPAYFEDNDYHHRMSLAGIAAIVLPTALFYHYGSATNNEASENGDRFISNAQFDGNRIKFVAKWGGLPGNETFTTPYNDLEKNYCYTQQQTIE